MSYTTCDHLGDAHTCLEPGTDGIRLCVCTSVTAGSAVVRLKRGHGPAHGRFVAVTPPSGFAAAFRLEHDTTSTQPTSTLYSPPFAHPGTWPYKVQVVWTGGTIGIVVPESSAECQESDDAA